MPSFLIENLGNQMRYSWSDEFGLHQYFSDIVNDQVGEIINYGRKEIKKGLLYTWNDNSGIHQHYVIFDWETLMKTEPVNSN